MSTKELIHAEIDKLGDEGLEQLYRIVRTLAAEKAESPKPGLLASLREVPFDGPADFSANLDQYLSGAKQIDGVR